MKETIKWMIITTLVLGTVGQLGAFLEDFVYEGIEQMLKHSLQIGHYFFFLIFGLIGMLAGYLRGISVEKRQELDRKLEESRNRLEYLLSTSPAVTFTSEPRGDFRTTFMSKNVRDLIGYEAEEFLTKPNFWVNCIHPEDREHIFSSFSKLPEECYYNEIYRLQHKNGSYCWVLEEAQLIKDDQGEPIEIIGYWTDITTYKQTKNLLRESEVLYRSLFNNIPIGLYRTTPDGEFISANPTFLEMLGYNSLEELSKISTEKLAQQIGYSRDKFLKLVDQDGQVQGFEQQIQTIDGSYLFVRENTRAIKDENGSIVYYEGTFEDITERKQMEKMIQQKSHDLEERIKELNCLYRVSQLTIDLNTPLTEVLQEIIFTVPEAWQYPDITCARIILEGRNFITNNFKETPWRQSTEIFVSGEGVGFVEVYYLKEKPKSFEGPFLKEERKLIDAIAQEIGEFIERKRVEKALRTSEMKYRTI
ncbi:MAG: PAS domain-containing protein, partial [Candidatus Thorarchaeota archaeon]